MELLFFLVFFFGLLLFALHALLSLCLAEDCRQERQHLSRGDSAERRGLDLTFASHLDLPFGYLLYFLLSTCEIGIESIRVDADPRSLSVLARSLQAGGSRSLLPRCPYIEKLGINPQIYINTYSHKIDVEKTKEEARLREKKRRAGGVTVRRITKMIVPTLRRQRYHEEKKIL